MDLQLVVDKDRCIGCEECVKDCPFGLLAMKGEMPAITRENEEQCIGCQHCMAVCTTGAISVMGLNPDESIPLPGAFPPARQVEALIKGRRSVRRYHHRSVPKKTISFLLETALFAPTAVNNCDVLFTVVEDVESMEEVRKKTYDALKAGIESGSLPKGMEYVEQRMAQGFDKVMEDMDLIFRGAPHLLVASAPKDGFSPEVDCLIALSYFEVLATSMGLGTLWCGLAKAILTLVAPEILAGLGVPASHRIGYIMAFGEPNVTYQRTIQPGKPKINWARQIVA
ncbi:MAG: hypothetical protein A2277_13780 [Desulfobacterales bacterium RIFOXYA12_FULL_46_15]|nr:MAG: hypothetical protein A2277_13780 [Desulfobacterales bacterium RIFOXYA12_FULL_46_15]